MRPASPPPLLRAELAATAEGLGLEDLDLSAVTGPHRRPTREATRYVHDVADGPGGPAFASIRYLSRLNPSWELWAVFFDRMLCRILSLLTQTSSVA